MKKTWLYYGIFFDEKTKDKLLREATLYIDVPWEFPLFNEDFSSWKKYCDHITIVYNDGSKEKQSLAVNLEQFLGTEETITVTHMGVSDRAVAFGVDYETTNKHSHITVAVAPGAKPVESNDITEWHEIDPFVIKGRLGKVTN